MQVVSRAYVSLIAIDLLLHSAHGVSLRLPADDLSLMQVSVLKTEAASTGQLSSTVGGKQGSAVKANSTMEAAGLPIKSIQTQLKQTQTNKSPPEPGFHKKMLKALPTLESECPKKSYILPGDCERAVSLLKMLISSTVGPEPVWTYMAQAQIMMGLHFWLYTPGTLLCYTLLDRDQNGNLTWTEMEGTFGAQMMAAEVPIWKYMDNNTDGNVTRAELYDFLRGAILVRDVLPQLDTVDPKAGTEKCLNMAHRILHPPVMPPKKLSFYPKLLSIAGIAVGAVAVHCLWTAVRGGGSSKVQK